MTAEKVASSFTEVVRSPELPCHQGLFQARLDLARNRQQRDRPLFDLRQEVSEMTRDDQSRVIDRRLAA